MSDETSGTAQPMRILYLEDNPLIVFHIEQLVEDLGHIFVGALGSFSELREQFSSLEFDGALVDVDLADGSTGPDAAAWLAERGIPTIFVTGQVAIAARHSDVSLGVIGKPVSMSELASKIELFRNARRR
jgi:CheY-like chemotaxis protein